MTGKQSHKQRKRGPLTCHRGLKLRAALTRWQALRSDLLLLPAVPTAHPACPEQAPDRSQGRASLHSPTQLRGDRLTQTLRVAPTLWGFQGGAGRG